MLSPIRPPSPELKVTLVSVGTQVSGRVSKLYVDFNDKVEKGQVLLELDDALFNPMFMKIYHNMLMGAEFPNIINARKVCRRENHLCQILENCNQCTNS